MRIQVMFYLSMCAVAAAQERPQQACSFDGFSADGKLAEVKQPTTGYRGCESLKSCVPAKLAAGDVVTPYHTSGDWTCSYIQQSGGAGPGWVRASDIRELHADAAPALKAWAGTWANGNGRIQIATDGDGKLHLKGENEWHGAGDVVHTGEFDGLASPLGNHLRYAGSNADSCTIDLTLIGQYLVANDNDRCGGMNVRFWGIWKRAGK